MKPLVILLVAFLVSLFTIKVSRGEYNFQLSARIALSIMLFFTASGHFVFTKGMTMMIPDFIPYRTEVVYFTGFIELTAAIALHIPLLRVPAAWFLVIFFILILPANIYAAMKQVDYQKGTYEGSGLSYLWFRVPLQLLFIAWVYFSSIKS